MNSSEFSLYGMCPFYDQTILVHCHICKFITKISQLTDHLLKRHGISNTDQLDELAARLEATATIGSESTTTTNGKSLSSNELKSNGGEKQTKAAGKRGGKANKKQQPSLSTSVSTSALPTPQPPPSQSVMPPPPLPPLPVAKSMPPITESNTVPAAVTVKQPVVTTTKTTSSSSSMSSDPASKIENEAKLKYVVEKIKSKLNSTSSNSGTSGSSNNGGGNTNKQSSNNNKTVAQQQQSTLLPSTADHLKGNQSSKASLVTKQSSHSAAASFPHNQPIFKSETSDAKKNVVNASVAVAAAPANAYAPKIIKTYDPDRHCGVVTEVIDPTSGKKVLAEPCLRSLTCKKHSISARRQVVGRSRHFNELFKAYRDEKLTSGGTGAAAGVIVGPINHHTEQQAESPKKLKSHQSPVQAASSLVLNGEATTTSSKQISPNSTNRVVNHHQHQFQPIHQSNNPPAVVVPHHPQQPHHHHNQQQQQYQSLNLNYMNMQVVKHHPRPSAVTSFNARLTDYGGGYALWNRRQDNLRHVLTDCFMKNPKVLRQNASFIFGEATTKANQSQVANEKFKNEEASRNGPVLSNLAFKPKHQQYGGLISDDAVKMPAASEMLKTSMSGADSLMFASSSFISSDEMDEERNGGGGVGGSTSSTLMSRKRNHHHYDSEFDQIHHHHSSHVMHHHHTLLSPSALKMPKLDELLSLNMIESDAIQDYTDVGRRSGVMVTGVGGHDMDDEADELSYLYTSDTNRLVVGGGGASVGGGSSMVVSSSAAIGIGGSSGVVGVNSDQSKHTHHNLSSLSLSPSPSSSSSSNSSSSSSTNSSGGGGGIPMILCSNSVNNNNSLRNNNGHHHNHHQFNATHGSSTSILN